LQQGSGHVSLWWREYGAFVQDQIRLSPNLQASIGLRYDWQAFFHDANNFGPRASLAWSPRKDGKTIVRAGAGVFYDRSGVGPVANLMLHDGATLRSFTILNPSYPDPLAGGLTLAGVPTNVTRLASDIQIPYSVQYSLNVERQLGKTFSIVGGYRGTRGHHLFRSVDTNAPLPPDFTSVPDPALGHVQEIRSDGRLRSDALELTLRGRYKKTISGQVQYTFSRAINDTGGINWYRNMSRNWQRSADIDHTIRVPSLMIMAENDAVLPPSAADGMEKIIPDLEKYLVRDSGHWTQQEKPDEVSAKLIEWRRKRFG